MSQLLQFSCNGVVAAARSHLWSACLMQKVTQDDMRENDIQHVRHFLDINVPQKKKKLR